MCGRLRSQARKLHSLGLEVVLLLLDNRLQPGIERLICEARDKVLPSHHHRDCLREMENISRGPIFGDFVIIRTETSMQDVTNSQDYRVKEYRLHLSTLF
jgi:hypothetical protein